MNYEGLRTYFDLIVSLIFTALLRHVRSYCGGWATLRYHTHRQRHQGVRGREDEEAETPHEGVGVLERSERPQRQKSHQDEDQEAPQGERGGGERQLLGPLLPGQAEGLP